MGKVVIIIWSLHYFQLLKQNLIKDLLATLTVFASFVYYITYDFKNIYITFSVLLYLHPQCLSLPVNVLAIH